MLVDEPAAQPILDLGPLRDRRFVGVEATKALAVLVTRADGGQPVPPRWATSAASVASRLAASGAATSRR